MIKDIDGLIKRVTEEIRDKMDIAVLGLSGGADSTLVAVLCKLALGKDNVYGVHLPYNELDKDTFNARSVKLAKHLGINDRVIDIGPSVDTLREQFDAEGELSTLNQGNMRSRMRMVSLYTFNCVLGDNTGKRCRVVGTGQRSEDYIGYDTLGGDSLADLFVIGTLYKSEVYQLLDYFIDQKIITDDLVDRIPSAGLYNGQTDADELGYTYNQMEPSIRRCLVGQPNMNNLIDKFVWERHVANKHKHEARPVLDLDEFCEGE